MNAVAVPRLLSLTLLALLWLGPAQARAPIVSYAELDMFSFSEPFPIETLRPGGNAAWTHRAGEVISSHSRVALGARVGAWGVAAITRVDLELAMHPDTAEFIYLIQTKQRPEAGRDYRIDLAAEEYHSVGVMFDYAWEPREGLMVAPNISLLRGHRMTSATLRGSAAANDATEFDVDALLDSHHSEDHWFRHGVSAPQGVGYSVGLLLDWRASERWSLTADLRDLLGAIHWRDAPYTRAQMATDNYLDPTQDDLARDAVISGRHGYRDYVQRLAMHGKGTIDYRVHERLHLLSDLHYSPSRLLTSYGLGWRTGRWRLDGLYDPGSRAYSARLQTPHFSLSAAADSAVHQNLRLARVNAAVRLTL